MVDKSKKIKKISVDEQKINELTADLQRTRADFENYVKRCDMEKTSSREAGQASAILNLLPVIDNIERAITHIPDELKDNSWAQGVAGLVKNLDKSLDGMGIKRIDAKPGTVFNPNLHEAIQFEDADGEHEVILEEMQPGYLLNGRPIRHAMVRVTRQ